jgi:hypothetical protein
MHRFFRRKIHKDETFHSSFSGSSDSFTFSIRKKGVVVALKTFA